MGLLMRKRDEDRVIDAVQRKVDEAYRAGFQAGLQAAWAASAQAATIAQAQAVRKDASKVEEITDGA